MTQDSNNAKHHNFRGALYHFTMVALIVVGLLMIFNYFGRSTSPAPQELLFSQFHKAIYEGKIAAVRISGRNVDGLTKEGMQFKTLMPEDESSQAAVIGALLENEVQIKTEEQSNGLFVTLLITLLPWLLILGIWLVLSARMSGGQAKLMSFGKARPTKMPQKKVTFVDVAGVDGAKEELMEVVEFLRDPKKLSRLGGRVPKGVLLEGPPGTGKTLLARAVAGEAGVPFLSITGSDFVEMFVGVGASRVRDLFTQARKSAPCIIFVDEIDAVGRFRGAGIGGGHDEREQTLNALLAEMDGFDGATGIIVIAATNRPDVLDPALLRPGRFDRQVDVPRPDAKGREEIFRVHTKSKPLDSGVDLSLIARGTPGFSGADIENMVNEAALIAAKRPEAKCIMMQDLEEAKDKVLMGKENKTLMMSEEERRNTAYHEAGHTLVACMLPGADPVHKVSIIPRGRALGITQQLPEEDKHNYSKDYLTKMLAILMAGRAAEEIVLNTITTGASNDIDRATGLARKMACSWGMSEKLGPLSLGKREEQIFLGRELGTREVTSEATAKMIEDEIRRFVEEAAQIASKILKDKTSALHALAKALLDHETIDGEHIRAIVAKHGNPSGIAAQLV